MSDEHLDRAVRDADPYRPQYARSLGGAEQTLLEEIMSNPTVVRRPPVYRFAAAAAAAVAVTGVLTATALIGHHPDRRAATPPSVSQAPSHAPTVTAKGFPRLVIGDPGWKATRAETYATDSGSITFAKGTLKLDTTWYAAGQYQSYYKDRLDGSNKPTPITVDGWPGKLFKAGATRFSIMLNPRDGVFFELGTTSDGWTWAEFDRVRALIHRVDTATWYAAMPPEIITPPRAAKAAAKELSDVPLPPGFDIAEFTDLGVNDHYQFIANATGRVGCAWIVEWIRADKAGDQAAEKKAATALRGSHQWKGLRQINTKGGYSSVFWDLADKTAAGKPPSWYKQGLDCR
jgi:hypothetical protein